MFKDEGEPELVGAETLFREIGHYQLHKLQFLRSLPAFNKAIELTPNDRRALMGRSWARAKVVMYPQALEDCNKALKYKPDDLDLLQLKALLIYLSCDFEDSLVENIRGLPKRKYPNYFFLNAMQSAEAVERCIGKRGGHALRDHYDIIRKLAWKRALDLLKGYQPKPRFKKKKKKQKPSKTDQTPLLYTKCIKSKPKAEGEVSVPSILESLTDYSGNKYAIAYKEKSPYQPPQPRTTNIDAVIAEKYLDEMCYDKACLSLLRTDPRLKCPNLEGTRSIKQNAKYGFKCLSYRQEILRTRQPFYSIKYGEAKAKGLFALRQKANLEKLQNIAKDNAETLIKQLQAARDAFLTNDCIEIAERAKTFIDKKPLKILPEKEMYLKQLYDIIGLAHLDCYRLNPEAPEWNTIKRINFMFGLPISREPSQDSVIKESKKKFMNTRKAIRKTEDIMPNATTPLELIWLYYTLARFNIDLRKYDLGKFYARKCINMARILNNDVWTTNSSMLIAKASVMQNNRNEAKNELVRCLDYAKKLGYKEILDYIKKCIDVVETIDYEESGGNKVIEEREKQIISAVMGTELQEGVKLLFTRMSALPASRKMSIMPGVVNEEKTKHKSVAGARPSIKPQPKTAEAEMLTPNFNKLKQDIFAFD